MKAIDGNEFQAKFLAADNSTRASMIHPMIESIASNTVLLRLAGLNDEMIQELVSNVAYKILQVE